MFKYNYALEYYLRGIRDDSVEDKVVSYFLYNNAGYCLNNLGEHKEAEGFCRQAIAIDSTRHNAYKNLGIALQGQEKYQEAAKAYRTADSICPEDPRAKNLLNNLIKNCSIFNVN